MTNEEAIRRWAGFPRRGSGDAMEPDGDFARRHLLNPVLLRMLGDVSGRRVLDAGCGHGYLSRMLADRGAQLTGVEPAEPLFDYAVEREARAPLGIRYFQADLCLVILNLGPVRRCCRQHGLPGHPRLGGSDEGVRRAFWLRAACWCSRSPTRASSSWALRGESTGEYRTREYFAECEIAERYASNFHRPLSAYFNQLARLGCHLREVAEPALDPETATAAGPGADAYVHLPNFLVVAAEREKADLRIRSRSPDMSAGRHAP